MKINKAKKDKSERNPKANQSENKSSKNEKVGGTVGGIVLLHLFHFQSC
jgi:hypothetical protein